MTAEEGRDLGYLKWKDPWAWMESMKGKRWENLIKKEKQNFNELATQPSVEKEARQIEQEIVDAQQYSKLPGFKIGCGTVDILLMPNYRFVWKWTWKKVPRAASDLDVIGNAVWYVTGDPSHPNTNKLVCETSDGKVVWSKHNVSAEVAVIDDLCYYIKTIDYFRTVELCVCNSHTGTNEKIIYKEPDKGRDLILYKCSNKSLYMASASPVNSRLYAVDKLELKQIGKNTLLQRPLGKSVYGEDCYLYRNSRFERWSKKGKPLEDWILPDEEIEWINLQSGNLVTINEGSQTLWFCEPKKKPEVIMKLKVGYLDVNVWTQWENSLIQTFVAKTPSEPPYIFYVINNKITRDNRKFMIPNPIKFKPLEVHRFHATSKDGTKVPYVIIHEKGIKPKAQFIYIYGAYGSSTPIGWPYGHWYPLLKRKWAMVFAMVRGGGDIDAAWAELARRENRHVVIEDFEAVIRGAQHKNNLGPKETVIYGRSAGGLPIGAIVARFPYGELVGAAFAEVPYVDVLRTSSNPDLPLTIGEFEEFGNPLEKIVNFRALMEVSPVNTLPPGGAPGVFVMSRVGLLDRQVYAYESFKWIQKLRGYTTPDESNMSEPKGKYVTFERKEAHFYRPKRFPRFRAIDFAILDNWVDGKLKF